ncbi:MAG: DUF2760 domain-containing protein [Planctomycetaceae bacterium]
MNVLQRVGVGLKAWYWAWFVEGGAERIGPAVANPTVPALEGPKVETKPVKELDEAKPAIRRADAPRSPVRSEALTLLEALQREARLVDFLKEDIAAYQDAQIGAAVRDIHRDAAKALERMFALRSVLDQAEGDAVTLDGSSADRVRLVGNVREGATAGTLVHHGWTVTKVELPLWSGPQEAANVVAPAEVEVS